MVKNKKSKKSKRYGTTVHTSLVGPNLENLINTMYRIKAVNKYRDIIYFSSCCLQDKDMYTLEVVYKK